MRTRPRRWCACLLTLLLLLLPLTTGLPAAAQAQAGLPPEVMAWTAEAHHGEATRLLNRGRTYERAILHARAAAAKEPGNAEYQAMLGCACTARAASLVYAFLFSEMHGQMRRQYARERKAWEAARQAAEKDGTAFPEEGAEEPVPPPEGPFGPKDDDRPFAFSRAALSDRLDALFAEARAAFDAAREKATPGPQRAEIQYVRGWGLLLLRLYGHGHTQIDSGMMSGGDEDDEAPPPAPARKTARTLPPMKDVVAAFREATEGGPENPAYWQSLGDALEAAGGSSPLSMAADARDAASADTPVPKVATQGESAEDSPAVTAFRKSLGLYRRNAPLWHHLAHQSGDDEKVDQDALKALVNADPANALPLYLMAAANARKFEFTRYGAVASTATPEEDEEAGGDVPIQPPPVSGEPTSAAKRAMQETLRLVERANLVRAVRPLRYRPWVPKLLGHAFDYAGVFIYEPRTDDAGGVLAGQLQGYARWCARKGDPAEARRALRALIGMGEKMAGDWPLRDRDRASGETNLCAEGLAVLETTLQAQREVCLLLGDAAGVAQTARVYEAFTERKRAWEEARGKMGEAMMFVYY